MNDYYRRAANSSGIGGESTFGSTTDKLEHKIKELNALKAEYRQELEEAEKRFKKGDIDKAHLERVRARTEEHVERINEKIRVTREKLQESRAR